MYYFPTLEKPPNPYIRDPFQPQCLWFCDSSPNARNSSILSLCIPPKPLQRSRDGEEAEQTWAEPVTAFGGCQADPSPEEKKLLSRQTKLHRPRWSRLLPAASPHSVPSVSSPAAPGTVQGVSGLEAVPGATLSTLPANQTQTQPPQRSEGRTGRGSEQLPEMGCGVGRWRGTQRNPQGNTAVPLMGDLGYKLCLVCPHSRAHL